MPLLSFFTDAMWPNSIYNVTAVIVANYYLRLLASCTYWNNICNSSVIDRRRHVGWSDAGICRSTLSRKAYSSKKLIDISKSQPKERFSEDLWKKLGEMGIRKPFRSKRKRKKSTTVVPKANPAAMSYTGSQPLKLTPALHTQYYCGKCTISSPQNGRTLCDV